MTPSEEELTPMDWRVRLLVTESPTRREATRAMTPMGYADSNHQILFRPTRRLALFPLVSLVPVSVKKRKISNLCQRDIPLAPPATCRDPAPPPPSAPKKPSVCRRVSLDGAYLTYRGSSQSIRGSPTARSSAAGANSVSTRWPDRQRGRERERGSTTSVQ